MQRGETRVRQSVQCLQGDPPVGGQLAPGDRHHAERPHPNQVLAVSIGSGAFAKRKHAQAGEREAHCMGLDQFAGQRN